MFLIEVSSSEDLKEPENEAAEISQPSLILDKPISDPFQSLGGQLTISHLGATWSSFDQITSNHFSDHLRSLHLQLRPSEELRPSGERNSDHLEGGDTVLAVAPAGRLGPVDPIERLEGGEH